MVLLKPGKLQELEEKIAKTQIEILALNNVLPTPMTHY